VWPSERARLAAAGYVATLEPIYYSKKKQRNEYPGNPYKKSFYK
jgi:hypothetical protein